MTPLTHERNSILIVNIIKPMIPEDKKNITTQWSSAGDILQPPHKHWEPFVEVKVKSGLFFMHTCSNYLKYMRIHKHNLLWKHAKNEHMPYMFFILKKTFGLIDNCIPRIRLSLELYINFWQSRCFVEHYIEPQGAFIWWTQVQMQFI